MNKTLKTLSITAAIAAFGLVAQPAFAGESGHQHAGAGHGAEHMDGHSGHMDGHEAGHANHKGMDMATSGMFLKKKMVDGFMVSFHVMKPKSGMKHGGSHNLMVKVEKNDTALTDIAVNSKVFYADKTTESKMLMKMGDWYMAGYDLEKAGKHGIMVLFKTADGKKHKTSVYYKETK